MESGNEEIACADARASCRASCHPHFNVGSNAPDCVIASKYFEGPDELIRNALSKTPSPDTLMCRPCSVIRRFDVVDRSVCLCRLELFSDFVENGVAWVCPIRERLLNVRPPVLRLRRLRPYTTQVAAG